MEKLTIAKQYEMVKAVLKAQGEADLVAFIEGRMAVNAKKAENRKPTKNQVANEALKVRIKEVLGNADKPMTATEILNADINTFGTVQKVTALLKGLVDAKKVVKTVDKKKAYFALAE